MIQSFNENKVDHFLVKFRLPLVYQVGFSIKGDVEDVGEVWGEDVGEVGGEVWGQVGGEDGGEDGGEVGGLDGGEDGSEDGSEKGDDYGGKDGIHTNPVCFDYPIWFGNSIIPMIPTILTHINQYKPIQTCTNQYQPARGGVKLTLLTQPLPTHTNFYQPIPIQNLPHKCN